MLCPICGHPVQTTEFKRQKQTDYRYEWFRPETPSEFEHYLNQIPDHPHAMGMKARVRENANAFTMLLRPTSSVPKFSDNAYHVIEQHLAQHPKNLTPAIVVALEREAVTC